MDDNFTEEDIQSMLKYLKYHEPGNANRLFAIAMLRLLQEMAKDLVKTQLDKSGVKLVDLYGIISGQTVNTLENLGVEYSWSKYSPTKKTEILEAEHSKDEVRDILSRLVGSEIRYARLGYWMRRAPDGYDTQKVGTEHGKYSILTPTPRNPLRTKNIRAASWQATQRCRDCQQN